MQDFFRKHWWWLFNLWLFANVAIWCGWNAWNVWRENRLDYVAAVFIVQNFVFAGVILLRTKHKKVEGDLVHQAVALIAFWSGMLFMGQPAVGGPAVVAVAQAVTVAANVLGIACLFNLGRSFGILIACRKIKTAGLYGVVRHPMYGTDILLRIGFLIGHFNPYTAALFTLSTGCYVWRAVLEERFLSATAPEYSEYMWQVRWRLIPWVFWT